MPPIKKHVSDEGAGHADELIQLLVLCIASWGSILGELSVSAPPFNKHSSCTTHDLTFVVESQARAEVTLGSCAPAPMTDADIDAMQM